MFTLSTPSPADYPTLLEIWEASVRATHSFVSEDDIEPLKKTIQEQQLFHHSAMTVARDENGIIAGFMGVSGNILDMIFLDPRFINKGAGKMLVRHAIDNLGVNKVDVNEDNEHARGFYEHFGFKVVSRSPIDDYGRPFPLLHMQR